jgi:hypothetical protein
VRFTKQACWVPAAAGQRLIRVRVLVLREQSHVRFGYVGVRDEQCSLLLIQINSKDNTDHENQ